MSVTTCEIHGCGMPFARAIDGVGLCAHHAGEALALNIARTNAACAYDERVPSRDYKTRSACVTAYHQNVVDTAREYRLDLKHTKLALKLYGRQCKAIQAELKAQRELQRKVDAMHACAVFECLRAGTAQHNGKTLCTAHLQVARAQELGHNFAAEAFGYALPGVTYQTRQQARRGFRLKLIAYLNEQNVGHYAQGKATAAFSAEWNRLVASEPKRKVGRPRKPVADRKGTIVRVRVKPAVIAELTRRADAAGVKVSELVGDLVNTFVAVADASEREPHPESCCCKQCQAAELAQRNV